MPGFEPFGGDTDHDAQVAVLTPTKLLPPYHVVLLDDDDHSFEYVIHMLQTLFGHPPEKGKQFADEVNNTGRAIICTTSKERAEFKRDQIHGFGPDQRISRCQGSMSSVIEPAE